MPADYLEPYRRAAARKGSGFGVTLWASEKAQRRRFAALVKLGKFRGQRVLDAGCSRGDFAAFLHEKKIPFASYIGVDAIASVIDFANSRGLPRCRFVAGDMLMNPSLLRTGDPDIICLSGTLNTMSDEQVYTLLAHAFTAARHTLIFNFLSDRADPRAPFQFGAVRRFDTMKLLDWAMAQTSQVAFRQDYFRHGHDATVVMRKS